MGIGNLRAPDGAVSAGLSLLPCGQRHGDQPPHCQYPQSTLQLRERDSHPHSAVGDGFIAAPNDLACSKSEDGCFHTQEA